MQRWPEAADLAGEPAGEAVRAWGRLGYPRRALRLHAAAVAITENHGGVVPSDEQQLRDLPGVGEYTAAAVRAFAFGLPSVVLDVNVRRVLARAWSGVAEPPGHLTAVERALAEGLAHSADDPAQWAAASMELGAVVCTKREPDCQSCPLLTDCAWQNAGAPKARSLLGDNLATRAVTGRPVDGSWPRSEMPMSRYLGGRCWRKCRMRSRQLGRCRR